MSISKNALTYAKRRDRNHNAAVKVVEANGYFTFPTNITGEGFPDVLVVSRTDPRIVVLFEIKVDNEKLRDKEIDFFCEYPGLAYVVRSGENNGQEAGYQILDIMREVESDLHCRVST